MSVARAAVPVPNMVALHEWRERLGVGRSRVAGFLGISERTLTRWELNGKDPGELKRRALVVLYEDMEANPERYST